MAHDSMTVAGIDIGKHSLDIACHPSGMALRVDNTAAGHEALTHWLARHRVGRIGPEASGGYERAVASALREAGFEVAVLQPRQVRAFALFRLKLAKNDRLDAALIAHCTAEIDMVRAAPDPQLEPLAEHLRLVEQLEADLARARTRAEAYRTPRLQRALAREGERLAGRVKAELLLLAKAIAAIPELARRIALIESVQGIGRRTALTLVILMPELAASPAPRSPASPVSRRSIATAACIAASAASLAAATGSGAHCMPPPCLPASAGTRLWSQPINASAPTAKTTNWPSPPAPESS